VSAAEELTSLLGSEVVTTDAEALRRASRDLSPGALIEERAGLKHATAGCVVRPASTDQVSTVLRWANDTGTQVVPFGAGSDVCGAIAPNGGVVLDLSRMNSILEVDEKSLLVRAQAGVNGGELAAYLEERDLMLGHQPQSLGISTVGGWLATRACGQLSAGYGGIEDLVTGFEAVLPGGRVFTRKAAPRRSSGPDVASLMLGSEGALGVITEATLRIVQAPVDRTDLCLTFEHMADGVVACRSLAQSDLHPTLVRLYDKEDAFILLRNLDDPPQGPILLLSFDGFAAAARAEAAAALTGGSPADPAIVEHWWTHRNDAAAEFQTLMSGEGLLGPHALIDTMEVAGTWKVLRDLYHGMKTSLAEKADLAACHLSHVYADGACLYFTLASSCQSDDIAQELLAVWWDVGMSACLAAGGTISHHHGIGRVKAPWLPDELGEWQTMLKRVKDVFDPKGIMNPGVLGL
jgi:alkyldihydroxyacetonephosphate synthase